MHHDIKIYTINGYVYNGVIIGDKLHLLRCLGKHVHLKTYRP